MRRVTHESIVGEIIADFGLAWAALVFADRLGFELDPGILWAGMLVILLGIVWSVALTIECSFDMLMAGIEGRYRDRDERWWA